ncbi:hypothetical protein BKP37_02530 [Anaerobacillus alkalilacustris]|uniref:DUF1829 domain-containing protein n=1 Tax=Anaerobacillus alkalilacustris TaxID=393763 RepID=A0A1S2LY05_9BACI|nr:hypothetical protein BKP37_02530 [Anaerobacillus alkalilacustris]
MIFHWQVKRFLVHIYISLTQIIVRVLHITESAGFIGKSGRSQTFDFALPRTRKVKPKLIKAINNPTSESYKDPLLSFIDVQETKSDHVFLVLANDTNIVISDKFIQSLENII